MNKKISVGTSIALMAVAAAVAVAAAAVADATPHPASKVPMWASVAKPTTEAR